MRACGGRIENRKKRAKASLSAASGRSGPGSQHRGFARLEVRGRRSIVARSSADFVAGAQHFRKVKLSQGLNCVAGAAFSQGEVLILWQVQHFCKVRYRFCGRCSIFAMPSTDFVAGVDFVAGAALSQGQAQIKR